MGIQRADPHTTFSNIRVARIKTSFLCQMIGEPADRLFLHLHWLGNRSYPCLGDECKCHEAPLFEYGYFPAIVQQMTAGAVREDKPWIVPFTANIAELAWIETPAYYIELKRQGNNPKSMLDYRLKETPAKKTSVHFDMKATLARIWKLPVSVFDTEKV